MSLTCCAATEAVLELSAEDLESALAGLEPKASIGLKDWMQWCEQNTNHLVTLSCIGNVSQAAMAHPLDAQTACCVAELQLLCGLHKVLDAYRLLLSVACYIGLPKEPPGCVRTEGYS